MPTISQLPTDTPLEIRRGDDVEFKFRIADPDNTGQYLDLSGYTAEAQVRESADSETVLADFTITDYDNGSTDRGIVLSLASADTANFPYRATWDLQLTDGGLTRTYLAGEVLTDADVTR